MHQVIQHSSGKFFMVFLNLEYPIHLSQTGTSSCTMESSEVAAAGVGVRQDGDAAAAGRHRDKVQLLVNTATM